MKIQSVILAAVMSLSALGVQAETRVLMETSMGNIELLLDEQHAPKTVENFVKYANRGFYNGTIFHRVINDFMIQGGGFTSDMLQKPTAPAIMNEADNGLRNDDGTIAMARTGDPHSATSQFFINVKDNPSLNYTGSTPQGYGYTVFGKVVKGMDVVRNIANVRTTMTFVHQDVPVKPVVIKSVKVVK